MRMGRLIGVFVVLISIASTSAARNLRFHANNAMDLQNRLNKPSVKSIQSPDGDIVDCILINQQPAFDHPLLADHLIQMTPTSDPKGHSQESNMPTQLWHTTNQTCPDGTVPIRRTKQQDLLRSHSLEHYGKKFSSSPLYHLSDAITENHEYAIGAVGEGNYYGAKATINVWQSKVEQPQEFSLSQLWIIAGSLPQRNLNSIEVGWQVFPQLYGDTNPRFFGFWTTDAYQSGCYNLECPGFVQVSKKMALGVSLAPVSVYAGAQYEITIKVWKDEKDMKWWLKFGEEIVGYWPCSLFSLMSDSATGVEFGGEIINLSTNGHTTTQMGSGHFADEGFGKASFFKNIQIIDSNNNLQNPISLSLFAPTPNCYNVKTTNTPYMGTHFFYGGPGRNPNCP